MKRYEYIARRTDEKKRAKNRKRQNDAGGFRCSHCRKFVVINESMGTANRNHCNWCLWSKHVDEMKGDRRATCQGGMRPIGLTFKHEGHGRVGEIMLIHLCSTCQKLSINRIARDDPEAYVIAIFKDSYELEQGMKHRVAANGIYLLGDTDEHELSTQLFGSGQS
jgi:hypothetical protein